MRREGLSYVMGYSETAQCTGNLPSYLEPNSGSLHVPTEGVYRVTEKIEGRSAIGVKKAQKYVENRRRTYLLPIRNTMQKPVGDLSASALHRPAKVEPINRGGISLREHNSYPQQNFFKTEHTIILQSEESSYAYREKSGRKRNTVRLVQPLRWSTHQNTLKNACYRSRRHKGQEFSERERRFNNPRTLRPLRPTANS